MSDSNSNGLNEDRSKMTSSADCSFYVTKRLVDKVCYLCSMGSKLANTIFMNDGHEMKETNPIKHKKGHNILAS